MAQDRARGVYKAVITVCVESSALRTVSFLLFIGPWGTTSYVEDIFFPPLAEVHVRAVSYDRHIPHHSKSCKLESIDKRSCRFRERRFDSFFGWASNGFLGLGLGQFLLAFVTFRFGFFFSISIAPRSVPIV